MMWSTLAVQASAYFKLALTSWGKRRLHGAGSAVTGWQVPIAGDILNSRNMNWIVTSSGTASASLISFGARCRGLGRAGSGWQGEKGLCNVSWIVKSMDATPYEPYCDNSY